MSNKNSNKDDNNLLNFRQILILNTIRSIFKNFNSNNFKTSINTTYNNISSKKSWISFKRRKKSFHGGEEGSLLHEKEKENKALKE